MAGTFYLVKTNVPYVDLHHAYLCITETQWIKADFMAHFSSTSCLAGLVAITFYSHVRDLGSNPASAIS